MQPRCDVRFWSIVAGTIVAAGAGAILLAQEAPTTKPGDPQVERVIRMAVPATQPVGAALIPATQPTTRPSKLALNFKDAPLDTVLDYLSEMAGLEVIKEGPVDGRVTVLSKQPLSPQDAVSILSAELKANGFTAILNGRQLRILPRDKAKKGSIPVHFGADPKDIADTDELITQVIPIKNIDATKLKNDLQPILPPAQDADVAANDGSNAIVITDASANIRRIVQIIADLDEGETAISDMRIVHLLYAKADAAVKLLETIFKQEAGGGGGQPQPGQPMVMGPNGPMPPQGGGGGPSHRSRGALHAAADDRTNTVILTGPVEITKAAENVLKSLDGNPVPASEIRAFPLKYAEAEATSKLIQNIFHPQEQNNEDFPFFFPRFGSGEQNTKIKVNTAFDERTNTVIVTAPAEAMKPIEDLIKTLDAAPGGATDIRVYPIKFADAYSIAKLINSIFNPPEDTGGRRFPFILFLGEGPNQNKRGVKVNATSDDRTNTVIVTAPPETMKIIDGIIHQVDANPGTEDTLFIYHLRNGQAQNLEIVLNTLFGNIQNQGQQNPQQQNQGPGQQNGGPFGNRQNNNGPGNGRSGRGLGSNRMGNNNGPGNGRYNRQNNRQQLSPGAAQAVNELTGEVFVVADLDTNSLIVTTAAKYEKEVREIIAELDRPVPQVLIKVLVAEVTHDNNADFGVDFSILNAQRSNGHGQTFKQTFGQPGSGLVVSFVEANLNATLHALAVQGKLDILSRPYILASDNQLAEILVGQQVPLVTNTFLTELGQTISNFEYQAIGIILDVTPHINPDGQVILDVSPEISQLTGQQIPISSTVSAPVIASRSAQSRVGVKDGQTIVIGGLMQDQKTVTVNKVPILGDIPIIKYAFSRTQVDKTKTELLIFLTPHVAQAPDVLDDMSHDELKGTRLTPRAVDPGMFDEHMKGMQRGGSSATQPSGPVSPVFTPSPSSQPVIVPTAPLTRPAPSDQSVRNNDAPRAEAR